MSVEEHEDLLKALVKHEGMVVLSGYSNDLYEDYLKGWRVITKATTAERGVKRVETLWINQRAKEELDSEALI